jgi:hypothetical protein
MGTSSKVFSLLLTVRATSSSIPMKSIHCLAAWLIVISLFANAPVTAISIYRNEPSFLAAAPIVSTETFDSYPASTLNKKVTLDSVVYDGTLEPNSNWPDPVVWSIESGLTDIPESKPNYLVFSAPGMHDISFGSGNSVNAFGFWILSFGIVPAAHLEIVIQENVLNSTLIDVVDDSGTGRMYFGFQSSAGIRQITVRDFASDGSFVNWAYDNVSRSSIVPEPSMLAYLALWAMSCFPRRMRNALC